MPYDRPTLATLIARVGGDISARTEGAAFLAKSVEKYFAITIAGVTHALHGHLDWVVRQLLPTTADEVGLSAWGHMLRVPRLAPTKAQGPATFTGTDATALPLGTALRAANDALYTVIVGGVVAAGTVTITIEADEAGEAGNLPNGATLALLSPLAGIDSEGVVAGAGLVNGTDLEPLEAYRARVVAELRNPESAGGPGSYEKWALEVAGVTRAWEFGNRSGVGTVSVAFVMDEREDIIPLPADVAAVQALLDARKPLDMLAVYVVAPIAQPVNMTIALVPNTAPVRAAVLTELKDLFAIEADFETSLEESRIDEAISTAQGETSHTITSLGALVPATWSILTIGTITFTG